MILLLSTANDLYWLGRHAERLKQLQAIAQLDDPHSASELVRAYGWQLADPTPQRLSAYIENKLLPPIISAIENNVQNVRGVIDQDTFELFNLVKRLQASGSTRAASLQLHACTAAMEYQHTDVKLFWLLGRCIEQIDNALRLEKSLQQASHELQQLLAALPKNTRWRELDKFSSELVRNQQFTEFQRFNQLFDQLITEGV